MPYSVPVNKNQDTFTSASLSRKGHNDSRVQLLHAYSIGTVSLSSLFIVFWLQNLRELGANAAEQNDLEARESDVTRVGNNERHNDRKLPTGYVILGFSFLFV